MVMIVTNNNANGEVDVDEDGLVLMRMGWC